MTYRAQRTGRAFFCICALGIALLFPTRAAHAAIRASFESPASDDIVAGVAVIRGWAFDDAVAGAQISVELFIDGVSQGAVACCTSRPDVAAIPEFASFPNTLNSGFGVTINWGNLSEGSHTIRVLIRSSSGAPQFDSGNRQITVVKPGNFTFLDQFNMDFDLSLSEVNEAGNLYVECVQVRDKDSGATKFVHATFRWQQACQCLVLISSEDDDEFCEEFL